MLNSCQVDLLTSDLCAMTVNSFIFSIVCNKTCNRLTSSR